MRHRALAAVLLAAVMAVAPGIAPGPRSASAQEMPAVAVEAEPFVSPLAPLDTSTPRATLATVQDLGRDLDAAFAAYREAPSFALQNEIRQVLARTDSVFDLATTPSALRAAAGSASFGYLKDILMRLPAIDPAALPGDAATAPDRFRLPGTEIELVRTPDGPQAGAYLFSADTVERLPEFHARIIAQPILQPAPYESWRIEQIRFTGPFVPGGLVRAMPEAMQILILGTPLWKMLFSAVVLAGAGMAAFRWAEHAGARAAAAGSALRARYWRLTQPLGLGVFALLARAYLIGQVNLSGRFFEGVQALTLGMAILAAAGVVRGVVLILGEHVNASGRFADRLYDRHLVRLISGVGGLAAACFVVLWGANSLGVPLLGLVAGMGVGGIALALAAQSTIENLFAGVSLFADRPFRVGDTIIYAGGEGMVESIGPRSTRIRAPRRHADHRPERRSRKDAGDEQDLPRRDAVPARDRPRPGDDAGRNHRFLSPDHGPAGNLSGGWPQRAATPGASRWHRGRRHAGGGTGGIPGRERGRFLPPAGIAAARHSRPRRGTGPAAVEPAAAHPGHGSFRPAPCSHPGKPPGGRTGPGPLTGNAPITGGSCRRICRQKGISSSRPPPDPLRPPPPAPPPE